MLGGFLVEDKFRDRSRLPERCNKESLIFSYFTGWLYLQRHFAFSTDISQYRVNNASFTSHPS